MRNFLLATALFITLILQSTLVNVFSIKGVVPDLVLVLVMILVVLSGFNKNWFFVLFAAIGLDFFSGFSFGIISINLLLSSFFIDWLNRKIFSFTKISLISFLIIGGILVYYILLFLTFAFLLDAEFPLTWMNLLIKLLYDLVLIFLIFYGIKKKNKKLFC